MERVLGTALDPSDQSRLLIENATVNSRYREAVLIGKGTSGTVWRAHDVHLGRKVAIKRVAIDSTNKQRIKTEVRLLARFNHPGILRLLDIVQDQECVYLIQNYCENDTLSNWIATTNASLSQRIDVFCGLLDAIEFFHCSGWIHGDIKPANVLIDGRRQPVVCDLGMSRPITNHADGMANGSDKEQEWIGSTGYMSPELLRHNSGPTERSDVYALGVTLYETLSGSPAFSSDANLAISQILTSGVPSLAVKGLQSLSEWNAIIQKATASDSQKRYGSAKQFAEDIRRVRHHLPISARKQGAWQSSQKWIRREPWTAGLALGIFAVAVVGLFVSLSAWRSASVHLTNLEIERDGLTRLTNEVKLTQQRLTSSIDEVRTATLEAETQEMLAVKATNETKSLEEQTNEAETKGKELETTSKLALNRSIEHWKSIVETAVKDVSDLDSSAVQNHVLVAKRNAVEALLAKIGVEHDFATLPDDPNTRFDFLVLFDAELERSQRVAIGRLDLPNDELKNVAFQSTILPGGYFVTDWRDANRPITFFHPKHVELEMLCEDSMEPLIDLGTVQFTENSSLPPNPSMPDSPLPRFRLKDSDGKTLANQPIQVRQSYEGNSEFSIEPIWKQSTLITDSEGLVEVPSNLLGTVNVSVSEYVQLNDVSLRSAESTSVPIDLVLSYPEKFPEYRFENLQLLGTANFVEHSVRGSFVLPFSLPASSIRSIEAHSDGRLLVSWQSRYDRKDRRFFDRGIGFAEQGEAVTSIIPMKSSGGIVGGQAVAVKDARHGLPVFSYPDGLVCCLSPTERSIYFSPGVGPGSAVYSFSLDRKSDDPIPMVNHRTASRMIIPHWDTSHLYLIGHSDISKILLPLQETSEPTPYCSIIQNSGSRINLYQMLTPRFFSGSIISNNKSTYIIIDGVRNGYYTTSLPTGKLAPLPDGKRFLGCVQASDAREINMVEYEIEFQSSVSPIQ